MIRGMLLCAPLLLGAASCVPGDTSGNSVDTNTVDANAVDTNTAAPALADPRQAQIDLVDGLNRGGNSLTVHNTTSGPIVLERVVANGLEGDATCDKKVFDSIAPGKEEVVILGACGVIRATKVYSDKGYEASDWTFEPFIEPSLSGDGLTIQNLGLGQYVVQQVKINGLDARPECNIKVFRDLPASGSLYVDGVSACGDVKKLDIVTDKGTHTFTWD